MQKVIITKRALVQRINRKLAKDNEVLKKSRGWHVINNLGEYYLLNTWNNSVIESHVNVEELGRDLKVMGAWEDLESDN